MDMDTKQSNGGGPILRDLENVEYPFVAIAPRFTQGPSGSTW